MSHSGPSPQPSCTSDTRVCTSPSCVKVTTTQVFRRRTVAKSGGAFHSKASIVPGAKVCTLHPSLPRSPGGASRRNSSSKRPPGHSSTRDSGAKNVRNPSDVVQAFQTSGVVAVMVVTIRRDFIVASRAVTARRRRTGKPGSDRTNLRQGRSGWHPCKRIGSGIRFMVCPVSREKLASTAFRPRV